MLLLHRHRAILWCAFGVIKLNQGGGVVSKAMLYARLHFEGFLFRDLSPLVQSLVSPSNAGGFVSSWMSCCCTDIGLSCGVHFGVARLNSRGVGLFEKPCFVPDWI